MLGHRYGRARDIERLGNAEIRNDHRVAGDEYVTARFSWK